MSFVTTQFFTLLFESLLQWRILDFLFSYFFFLNTTPNTKPMADHCLLSNTYQMSLPFLRPSCPESYSGFLFSLTSFAKSRYIKFTFSRRKYDFLLILKIQSEDVLTYKYRHTHTESDCRCGV